MVRRGEAFVPGSGEEFTPAGMGWTEFVKVFAGYTAGAVWTNRRFAEKMAAIIVKYGAKNVRVKRESERMDTWRVVWKV